MARREVELQRSSHDVPPVGRPRGAVWRALQADGVVWEGQVSLVGDDVDLAARMIVTHRRVVFVRGGELVLDVPREWLRPEPVLRRDGILDLFVTMPGGNLFDEPLTVPLRMREGHPAAGHIIAMLAPGGVRRILPESLSGMERAREAAPVPQFSGFWEVDDVRTSSTPERRPATNGYAITGLRPRDERKSPWRLILRLFALFVLLTTAAALGAGRLHWNPPGSSNSGAVLTGPSPTVAAVASPPAAPAAALAPNEEAAIALGVGGPATQADSVSSAPETAAAQTATEPPRPAAPTATPSPTTVPIPTPAPTAVPLAAATPAPATAAAAGEAVAPEVASETSPSTPNVTAVAQPAAVATDTAPAQELVAGPLRITITSAQRAESLPRYGLPPGSGEWVLLLVELSNEGGSPASFAMSDFRLYDREPGATFDLDSGTDVIAGLAGFDPPRSADDQIAVAPGESAEALLLYLLPPGSSDDVAFLAGETAMDLAPVLATGDATAAPAPELVEAKVSEVLDGARIRVDIGGVAQTVQYLGMQAPLADACFAANATDANRQLVDGETVWLERQASDRGADDVLLRDVWIAGQNGDRVLVSARLLAAGAGAAAAASPDTRYQAWLESAAALARTNRAGLWGACPDAESA